MEGVARRAVLAAIAGGATVALSGCNAGGDGGETDDADSGGRSSTDGDGGGDSANRQSGEAGLAGTLERTLGLVSRPADDDPDAELPLRIEHPPGLAESEAATRGPVDADAVQWAVGIDRPTSEQPRSVAIGEFADADPASSPGVERAGEVRSLPSYEFQDWLLVVGDDRLFLGDRQWIGRVLDRHAAGEPSVLDRHPAITELARAAGVSAAGRGWVVVDPRRWVEYLDVEPDVLAYTSGSPDGTAGRAIAYRFADGYDDGTVDHLQSAFADQFDLGPADVAVDERDATVVLEVTTSG